MISHDDSPSCQTCTHYRDQALRARTLRDVHRAGGVEAGGLREMQNRPGRAYGRSGNTRNEGPLKRTR